MCLNSKRFSPHQWTSRSTFCPYWESLLYQTKNSDVIFKIQEFHAEMKSYNLCTENEERTCLEGQWCWWCFCAEEGASWSHLLLSVTLEAGEPLIGDPWTCQQGYLLMNDDWVDGVKGWAEVRKQDAVCGMKCSPKMTALSANLCAQ